MKKITIILIYLLFSIVICSFIFGCTFFSPVVGKWQEPRTKDTIEFTRTGDVIIKSSGYIITGSYKLIGSDVIKLELEGLSGAWISLFGGDTWQYSISGDTMTVTASGQTSIFIRVSD
ncbi:MAG: hypothetical protein JXA17_03800 [Dehalococcoidales bacterium]|nr:hypothetical protein [Dehalococcoidales bacterium]